MAYFLIKGRAIKI